MKREIKFRAWDTDHQKMLTGFDIFKECYCDVIMDHSKDSIKWMQFTGLKDKNGKEIYEGDVIKYFLDCSFDTGIDEPRYVDETREFVETVYWIDEIAGFNPFCNTECEENTEVIGNIYENPELTELVK